MKEAKKARPLDAETAKNAKMLAGFGFDAKVIGEKLGYSEHTIIKLARDDYDLEKYLERKREENKKAAEKQVKVELVYDPSIEEEYRREQEAKKAEEQVPGQIAMDLTQKEPEEPDRIVKLIRFQAKEIDMVLTRMSECFDMLITKVDKMNDTMSMVLRAIRKE